MTRYLLDSDVLIEGKKKHYGMDFCPAFWKWLILQNQAGKVFSIDKVLEELEQVEDNLLRWAKGDGRSLFEPSSGEAIYPATRKLNEWVQESHYNDSAKHEFLRKADSYLISYGLAHEYTVVTLEKSNQGATKKPDKRAINKIKIPDACKAMKVNCITPFDMLRREKARFVLEEEIT